MKREWIQKYDFCVGMKASPNTVPYKIAITYNASISAPKGLWDLSRFENEKCQRKCLSMPPTPRKPAWLWLKTTKLNNSILKV
jgi:hypothetical protein